MPKPEAGSLEDLVITESTTVGDLMAVLSEARESPACAILSVQPAFDAVQGMPLASPSSTDTPWRPIPFECLTPENAIGMTIAMMSVQQSGG